MKIKKTGRGPDQKEDQKRAEKLFRAPALLRRLSLSAPGGRAGTVNITVYVIVAVVRVGIVAAAPFSRRRALS